MTDARLESSKNQTLLPCPFCGGPHVQTCGPIGQTTPLWYVACQSCEAEGPVSTVSGEIARKHWNERKGHETKPQAEARPVPQTLVDPLMLAAESILSEEHSKIIDQGWETAPVSRLRKALNNLQTYRANLSATIDEEWERAKDAMTGEPACDGCRRGFPKNEHGQHIWPSGIGGGDLRACKAVKAEPHVHTWTTNGMSNPRDGQECDTPGCGLLWKNRRAENGRP